MKHSVGVLNIISILIGLCTGEVLLWLVSVLEKGSANVIAGAIGVVYVGFLMIITSLIYAFELYFNKKKRPPLPKWITTLWFVMCISGLLAVLFWWLYM